MDAFTIVTTVIAFISLFLIVKNIKYSSPIEILRSRIYSKDGDDLIEFNGKLYRPIIYVGEPLNLGRAGEGVGLRLSTLVRQSRVNASIGSSLIKINKDKILKEIEDNIEKLRLAYEATKHVKYAERLTVLEQLYKEIAQSVTPYAGSFYLIAWLAEDEPETRAEALRALVEAETGIKLERFRGKVSQAIFTVHGFYGANSSIPLMFLDTSKENNIVIGLHPDYSVLYTLVWPTDFETHIGIIGPTGRGKTVLMSLIAFQLYTRFGDETSIIIIDPKGDLEELLEQGGVSFEDISKADDVSPCIRPGAYRIASADVKNRMRLARELLGSLIMHAEENTCRIPTVVFVDEAWKFLEAARKYMEASVREGRSRGLYIVYATQTSRDIPKDILDNTGVLMVFGGYTKTYADSAEELGLSRETLLGLPVGTIVLKKKGEPPSTVRVFNYEDYVKKPLTKSRIEGKRGVARIG